jgi:hypothetical protein
MNTLISKIKKVPLRELWQDEARDFTSWLEKNIDYLNEQVGLGIAIVEREKRVGDFSVDLVGENESGLVIIENQLERTDHDHLGKILTYLSMIGAKTAIWITGAPRDEHVEAVEWLNEVTPADYAFYLIKLEAIRIDNSPAAPLFSVEVGRSQVVKEAGKEKRKLAERHYREKEFWASLLERAKDKTDLFNNISPRFDSWIGVGGGRSGIVFNFLILKNGAGCEIYFDRGKGSDKLNKARFDELYSHKNEIEAKLGRKLEWQRLDNRRASRILIRFKSVGLREKERWPELQDKMIETMIKMKGVFEPYIEALEK